MKIERLRFADVNTFLDNTFDNFTNFLVLINPLMHNGPKWSGTL